MTDILFGKGQSLHDLKKGSRDKTCLALHNQSPRNTWGVLSPKEKSISTSQYIFFWNESTSQSGKREILHTESRAILLTLSRFVLPVAFEYSGAQQINGDAGRTRAGALLICNCKHGCCRPLDRERDSSNPLCQDPICPPSPRLLCFACVVIVEQCGLPKTAGRFVLDN